ncbi:CDGSH iron-sulfur domain-containing protein [Streptomyces sp. NPDC058682]|uniref:CDGSH iron-sulfur domain-containing protein n=1 Tax=Streptomyces sp. NPDC058682 TaxID=3346596 RepID=UPI003664CBB3
MPGRRAAVDPQGPVLVEGPVEIALGNGTIARSDCFVVAVCTCRRSRTYPWCDTSHRPASGPTRRPRTGPRDAPSQPGPGRPCRRPEPPSGCGAGRVVLCRDGRLGRPHPTRVGSGK